MNAKQVQYGSALELAIKLMVERARAFEDAAASHDERAKVAPANGGEFTFSASWHRHQAANLRDESGWIRSEAHALASLQEEVRASR